MTEIKAYRTDKSIAVFNTALNGFIHLYPESNEYAEADAFLNDHPDALCYEPLPPPPTDEQLEAAAESQRQARFAEYDTAIMQLRRHERLGDATATAKIAEWDAYAMALEAVNDTDGWFRAPEWPEKPAV